MSGMFEVRRAVPGDARSLAVLHRATVTVAYRDIFPAESPPPSVAELEADYSASLRVPQHVLLVADAPGLSGLAGSIALVDDAEVPAGWRIETFNVLPAHQGAGLGRRLYDSALALAAERGLTALNLWVLEGNDRARAIYEAWGWSVVPGRVYVNEPTEVLDVLYELDLRTAGQITS